MKRLIRIVVTLVALAITGILTAAVINYRIQTAAAGKIKFAAEEIPAEQPPRVAIVFGARVWADGSPSHALYDRVLTAVELYRTGRVGKLLMSGDNPTREYDEPTAMKKTAVELGVPESDIVLDFAGRRTYDSCYRAREIFGVERAVLVTQRFHLPRALYLCESFGIESTGVAADRRLYANEDYWHFREFFSVASAWWEVNFLPFEPIGGKPEPIAP